MPMPLPKEGESRDEFTKRFMGDQVMNDEYPHRDQRYAVALNRYDRGPREKSKDESGMGGGAAAGPRDGRGNGPRDGRGGLCDGRN